MSEDKTKALAEQKAKRFDVRMRVADLLLKIVIPIMTVLFGLLQLDKQQTAQEKTKFKSEMWLKKFQMYTELSAAIGELNVAMEDFKGDSNLRAKTNEFKVLYWKSTLVEDTVLTEALVAYNDRLDAYFQVPNPTFRSNLREELPVQGNDLIARCKKSLEHNDNFERDENY